MSTITKKMVCLFDPFDQIQYNTLADNLIMFTVWMRELEKSGSAQKVEELLKKGWSIREVSVTINF